MIQDIFDELKHIVDEQTRGVGGVANLEGVIQSSSIDPESEKEQHWFSGVVTLASNPDLNALLSQFTYERNGYEMVDALPGGTLQYPKTGTVPTGKSVFFTGVLRAANRRAFSIRVRSEGAIVSVFVNGVQIASGADNVQQTITVTAGDHPITVVAFRPTNIVTIQTDPTIEIVRAEISSTAPTWHTYPEVFAIVPSKGQYVNTMAWNNDPYASGWNVYRAQATILADITSTLPTLNADGTVTFELKTPSTTVSEGLMLHSYYFPLGVVSDVQPLVGPLSEDWATVTVLVDSFADETLSNWETLTVLVEGSFESQATVSNAGNDIVQFADINIQPNAIYVYKITALGSLGIAESSFSQAKSVWTYDEDPPTAIDTPQVVQEGFNLTVKFVAPDDPDYAGVRVYGPYPTIDGVPTAFTPSELVLTKYGEVGKPDQVQFRADEAEPDSYYYIATFDQLGNEQGPATRTVFSTGTVTEAAFQLTYDGPVDDYFGTATSITLAVNPADARNTTTQTVLIMSVFPKTATVQSWVDRVLLTGSTQTLSGRLYPALTLTDGSLTDRNVYEVIVTHIEGATVEFIATSSGTSMRPSTVTYRSDIDPFPGVSGVHVEDSKERPRIYATMDDDAVYLRLVNVDTGLTVFTATRVAGTDTATNHYNTVILDYTWTSDLTPKQVVHLRIDASKDGVTWNIGVWQGSIQGNLKASAIQLTATSHLDVNGNTIHDLTLIVSPSSATISATLNGDDITGNLVVGSTDTTYDNRTYTISIQQIEDIQKFIMTATKSGWYPASTSYVMDADLIPSVYTVSVSDTRDPALITAYCDDDAKLLRFVKIDGATRTNDTPIDVSSTKIATKTLTIAAGGAETWAIELAGLTGGPYASYSEVWRQEIKGSFGPTLTVVPEPGGATYLLHWQGTGTITRSIDNGTFTTPSGTNGGTPETVTLDTATHTYTYKAELNNQIVTCPVGIPAVAVITPAGVSTISITGFSAPNDDGAGTMDIHFSTTGFPDSVTYDLIIDIQSQSGATGPETLLFPGAITTDTYTIPGFYDDAAGLITVIVKLSGTTIGSGYIDFGL